MNAALVLLILFAVAYGLVVAAGVRNPMLTRLAGREATRRRGQTALVIGGLMVGTATITAALVAADSVGDSTTDAFAYRNWAYVDLTATAPGNAFFPEQEAAGIAAQPAVRAATDGVAGGIEVVGSATNLTRKLGTSGVTLAGFGDASERAFGVYELTDGRRTLLSAMPGGHVLVSRNLADKLDARPGDRIAVRAETPGTSRSTPGGEPVTVVVFGIARAEGPGTYSLGPVVFAPLPLAQEMLGTDRINIVRVSAPGGIRDADAAAKRALPVVEGAAATRSLAPALEVRNAKARAADRAQDNTLFLRAMLLGMSAIVVAAGAALVVNITGMLAEERRTRLGVLRALGLRRRKVVALSILEGAMYALAASVTGVAVGVGAGRLVAGRFGRAFAELAGQDFDFRFFFSLHPQTVVIGFTAGAVLTLLVVAIASRRTARMTITAAIRDLPEPASAHAPKRAVRIARLAVASVAGAGLIATGTPPGRMIGAVLLTVAASSIVRPRLSPRVHATGTGIVLAGVAFGLIAGQSPADDPAAFFGAFVVAMLTAVFGLTILVSANLVLVERGVAILGRRLTRAIAVLRPPLAYLSRRPVRTGLTTGVFALIVGMLTMFAVFLVIFKPTYDRFGAGYDVRVLSVGSPDIAVPASVQDDVERATIILTRGYVGPVKGEGPFSNAERVFVPLFTTPPDAARNQPVALEQRGEDYESDAAVWEAVLRDPTLIVSDFSPPDAELTLRGPEGDVTFTVIGSQSFGLLDGVFAGPAALKDFEAAPLGASMLVDLKDGVDAKKAARTIESSLFSTGVDAESIRELYETADRANRAFFSTIDILMRLGLVVGILSLGIVAMRVIVERRHVIGMLRAIGYKRKHVMAGLLAEAVATATIGVMVGATVGLTMGFIFWSQQDSPSPFGVDWASFGGVLAVVYLAVTVVALGPAWRASRLPPAEAVRYSE